MRIYLDHAATSWPKPPGVVEAMTHFHDGLGVSLGRGSSAAAVEVARQVDAVRRQVADRFGVPDAHRVVFTGGGTDALNLSILGTLRPGDHAVCSATDHNSVLRPLRELEADAGVQVTVVPCDGEGFIDADAWKAAFDKPVRLACLNHASNVTGALQSAKKLGGVAREAGAAVLLDACQTAGHVDLNLSEFPVDLVACSGHKGLMGPLGIGLLILNSDERPRPLRFGGTGLRSESPRQPEELPQRYEAGSLNVPGILGLGAAFAWSSENGRRPSLTESVWSGLSAVAGVRLFGPPPGRPRVGVISFAVQGWAAHDVSAVLESEFEIETRAGLHCAPLIHEALRSDGLVRVSLGATTTADEVSRLVEAVSELSVSAG